jgi:putative ABC transport system permease protein
VAYAVSQRTREIGVRVAVGASGRSVVTFMAAEGLRLVGTGLGVGVLLALAGTRLMRAFLLGVSPTDPLTFAAIAAGLAAVAVVACALPARRAARVDPAVALRAE